MKHPTIDPLRHALRDLLTASEDYLAAIARPSVRVIVAKDAETQADLVSKAAELSQAHLQARGVLAELAERLAEDDRETKPVLDVDPCDDDATDSARAATAHLSDDEIAARARRAARRVAGGKPDV